MVSSVRGATGPPARWLFYAHNRLSEPALAEVFDACRERDGIEPWFTNGSEGAAGSLSTAISGRQVSVAEAGTRSWDLVLATDNQRGERVPRGTRVRLPHGAAFGLNGYGVVSLGRCDLFVATSEAHRAFLERMRPMSGATTPIVVGGHPRLDRLFRGRKERGEVLRGIGLDPARPTVVVTSHWTREGNVRRFGAALPRAVLAALPEANVLQTGHPNIWQRVQYDISDPRDTLLSRIVRRVRRELAPFDYEALFNDLQTLAGTEPRFRLLPPDRTFEALSAADVLVSDLSSVTVEFTLFDRPIVLHRPAGLLALDGGAEAAYVAASRPFDELGEVGPALREAVSAPGARREERAALRDLCLDFRGVSGRRIVDVLTRPTEEHRSSAPE